MTAYYIGLMSGTSVDSIDGVLVSFDTPLTRRSASTSPASGRGEKPSNFITLEETYSIPIPQALREQLLQISTSSTLSLEQLGLLDNQLGNLFAECALQIINKTKILKTQILAIGSHGQNIYHNPQIAFTLQIANPNIIAKKTGLPVIHDFRRGDMALGGQGAPLAPLFHHAMFYAANKNRVILNLGGIANITVLQPSLAYPLCGFDTGPANSLIDALCVKYFHQPYDKNGLISSTGKIQEKLLTHLLQDTYFHKPPPKSTGKEYFNLNWLKSHLDQNYSPEDLLATLTELSAKTICEQINLIKNQHFDENFETEVVCCGGGVYNSYLLSRLQSNLNHFDSNTALFNTESLGLDPKWVEASLFAWLAKMRWEEKSLDLQSTTGSSRPVMLGAIYCP
jgi:anhydro-N-acetylmuramic acid kinase